MQGRTDGFENPQTITKSDTQDNVRPGARVIIVLTAGTVSLFFKNGQTLPFGALQANDYIPCYGAARVNSTGTSATVADAY